MVNTLKDIYSSSVFIVCKIHKWPACVISAPSPAKLHPNTSKCALSLITTTRKSVF